MIESISVADIATFGDTPETLNGLSQFNYIFGSNGTGKTTISRIITDAGNHPNCRVTWRGGTKLQAMVYNHDFVERNFEQSTELRGVFTLGEKNVDAINKIATTKSEIDKLIEKTENLNRNVQGENGAGGKKGELASLEEELKNKCWKQKKKHDVKLQGAFEGFRNSAAKFKMKVFQEWISNTASLTALSDLEKKAETIFGPTPTSENSIPGIETDAILMHETDPILNKRVIGKDDVDIAAMIKKLGNSDWVRAGRAFYEANDKVCPFCQQRTTDAFAQSLNEFFDEAFETDTKAINDLSSSYKTDFERLQQQINSILTNPSKFLDVEKIKAEKELLDSKVTANIQRLALKKKEPSQVVELESVNNVISTIKGQIDAANVSIAEHNNMVANITKERSDLTAQVWKYLLEVELKDDLGDYKKKKDDLSKAVASMEKQILETKAEKTKKDTKLRRLEKQTTSIQPTIDGINSILSSFGFQGFSLAKSNNDTCYKLVRPNGVDAKNTLSEGEKNFVSFLYFYHLLKGSDSESGMTTDRVVVFDDPVSSLDSDILFVVSSLIKGLFDEVRAGTGYIMQVFVLTHNVYFHKEVTFNPNRHNEAMNEETFWVVRKSGLVSKIEKHDSNPIKTSYELLWAEVRKPDRSNLAIQNTLRRILENYFKILGGVDPDKICAMFEGKDKLVCKSLFSWVNAGSHYAHDDLYLSVDNIMVETYLNVFKSIFDKSGHSAHYKMMMGDAVYCDV